MVKKKLDKALCKLSNYACFHRKPFGIKEGVDFDEVERQLIKPALEKAGVTGSSTAAI